MIEPSCPVHKDQKLWLDVKLVNGQPFLVNGKPVMEKHCHYDNKNKMQIKGKVEWNGTAFCPTCGSHQSFRVVEQ